MFIPTERRTWILKMVEKQVPLMKSKHQNHLSQLRECEYGAQTWKERRLLCESMFIPTERWTWILKVVEKQVFLMKPKHQNIYPNEENVIMVPNLEKNRDYYVNSRLSQLKGKLQF